MSTRTHRWKSQEAMKQVINKKYPENKFMSGDCSIQILFENSKYFNSSKIPYKFIFNKAYQSFRSSKSKKTVSLNSVLIGIPDTESVSLNTFTGSGILKQQSAPNLSFRDSSIKLFSDPSKRENFKIHDHMIDLNKLTANEYVVADCVGNLTNLKNSDIRCFFISPDDESFVQLIYELDKVKKAFNKNQWKSFRLIVASDGVHCEPPILRSSLSDQNDLSPISETSSLFEEEEEIALRLSNKFKDSKFLRPTLSLERLSDPVLPSDEQFDHAMERIFKAFNNGIEHSKKAALDIKVEIEELIDIMNCFENLIPA